VTERIVFGLGDMPTGRVMETTDEQVVRAPLERIFRIAADVEQWPKHLPHYRFVTMREPNGRGGGIVEMSANRPFGPLNWPTWWLSQMEVRPPDTTAAPVIRFRHVRGVTTGMEVEWSFSATPEGTHVRILHVWDGPRWPLIRSIAATKVIGPVFIHGIASRTLAGLARAAES
jgi:ribosome-associated toxin RatA of RatAB toxin-antitoxin module